MSVTVGDFLIQRIKEWGIRIEGYPGEGTNGFIGTIDRADATIQLPRINRAAHQSRALHLAEVIQLAMNTVKKKLTLGLLALLWGVAVGWMVVNRKKHHRIRKIQSSQIR